MAAKVASQGASSASAGPSYSFTMDWEENFDHSAAVEWFDTHSYAPYALFVLYLSVLYIGQKIMQNREPFQLKGLLMLWNGGLTIFSVIGFIRVFPEWSYTLTNFGFQYTVCNNSYILVKEARFWIYLFVLSKIPELIDTLFLVLKKQKLIFLHVYHHATVMIFAWYVFSNSMAAGRWFCTMNFGVHSIMYFYYVLKAVPNMIRIPKGVSMIITTLQSLQMVIGAYVVIAANYYHLTTGSECALTPTMSIVSLVIYISYLYLFLEFFYKAYLAPRPAKSSTENNKKRA